MLSEGVWQQDIGHWTHGFLASEHDQVGMNGPKVCDTLSQDKIEQTAPSTVTLQKRIEPAVTFAGGQARRLPSKLPAKPVLQCRPYGLDHICVQGLSQVLPAPGGVVRMAQPQRYEEESL